MSVAQPADVINAHPNTNDPTASRVSDALYIPIDAVTVLAKNHRQIACLLEISGIGKQLQVLLDLQRTYQACDVSLLHRLCTSALSSQHPSPLSAHIPQVMQLASALSSASDLLQSNISKCLASLTGLSHDLKRHAELNTEVAGELHTQPGCQELALERELLAAIQSEMSERGAHVARARGRCSLPPFATTLQRLKDEAASKFRFLMVYQQQQQQQRQVNMASTEGTLVTPPPARALLLGSAGAGLQGPHTQHFQRQQQTTEHQQEQQQPEVQGNGDVQGLLQTFGSLAAQVQQLLSQGPPHQQQSGHEKTALRGDAAPSTSTDDASRAAKSQPTPNKALGDIGQTSGLGAASKKGQRVRVASVFGLTLLDQPQISPEAPIIKTQQQQGQQQQVSSGGGVPQGRVVQPSFAFPPVPLTSPSPIMNLEHRQQEEERLAPDDKDHYNEGGPPDQPEGVDGEEEEGEGEEAGKENVPSQQSPPEDLPLTQPTVDCDNGPGILPGVGRGMEPPSANAGVAAAEQHAGLGPPDDHGDLGAGRDDAVGSQRQEHVFATAPHLPTLAPGAFLSQRDSSSPASRKAGTAGRGSGSKGDHSGSRSADALLQRPGPAPGLCASPPGYPLTLSLKRGAEGPASQDLDQGVGGLTASAPVSGSGRVYKKSRYVVGQVAAPGPAALPRTSQQQQQRDVDHEEGPLIKSIEPSQPHSHPSVQSKSREEGGSAGGSGGIIDSDKELALTLGGMLTDHWHTPAIRGLRPGSTSLIGPSGPTAPLGATNTTPVEPTGSGPAGAAWRSRFTGRVGATQRFLSDNNNSPEVTGRESVPLGTVPLPGTCGSVQRPLMHHHQLQQVGRLPHRLAQIAPSPLCGESAPNRDSNVLTMPEQQQQEQGVATPDDGDGILDAS